MKLQINKANIEIIENEIFTSNSVSAFYVQPTFSEEWANLEIITKFNNRENTNPITVETTEAIEIPTENLIAGEHDSIDNYKEVEAPIEEV